METTIWDKLRPYISKVIAAPVAIALVWLSGKTGLVDLSSAENQAAVVGGIVWLIGTLVHTFISKFTNPANTASSKLAKLGAETRAGLD